MARRVKVVMQKEKEAAKDLASGLKLCDAQPHGETVEEMVKDIQEEIERYLEALAAEENENRLSR